MENQRKERCYREGEEELLQFFFLFVYTRTFCCREKEKGRRVLLLLAPSRDYERERKREDFYSVWSRETERREEKRALRAIFLLFKCCPRERGSGCLRA
jgi:hypothetical protein